MEATKCIQCGKETLQKDGVCVICRTGITLLHEELVALLAADEK
jgi:hypothetical protein